MCFSAASGAGTDVGDVDERAGGTTDTALAVGAAVGGLLGKELFSITAGLFDDPNMAGAVQASLLLVITLGTLVYTVNKRRIPTLRVTSVAMCGVIGLVLGMSSSFLGIGGGPINLVVLFYFFTMATKRAAASSLYIILFSQATSTTSTLLTTGAPAVSPWLLAAMVACGILGGIVGRKINSRIDERTVDKLFIGLMVLIMFINAFNIYKFILM